VLVIATLTTLDRPEAHGVETPLDGGAGDEPGTVLEADLVRVRGVEVAASLYSGGGWWRRLR